MRTPEQKLATKLRQLAERKAHRERVFKKHPPAIRYAKAHHKKGSKRQKKRQPIKLGLQ